MSRIRFRTACISLLVGLFLGPSLVLAEKPVLLRGVEYGKYECDKWVLSVLNPGQIGFQYSATWVPPKDWSAYQSVLIAPKSPGQLQPEDAEAVKAFLSGGGNLILVDSVLSSLVPMVGGKVPPWADWLGTARVVSAKGLANYHLSDKQDLWPKSAEPDSGWGKDFIVFQGLTTAEPIVTDGTSAIIAVQRVGMGRVIFIGTMLFRVMHVDAVHASEPRLKQLQNSLARTIEPAAKDALEKKIQKITEARANATQSGITRGSIFLEGIQGMMRTLSPSTPVATPAHLGLPAGDRWVVWQRDAVADESIYGYHMTAGRPRFSPTQPEASEVVRELRIDTGQGEIASTFVNLTATEELPSLRLRLEPQKGAPEKALTFFRQVAITAMGAEVSKAAPTEPADKSIVQKLISAVSPREPDPAAEEFWLMPDTGGGLAAGKTAILWIRAQTASMAPGEYQYQLVMESGETSRVLPVTLKIWPVPFNRSLGLNLGFYGFNWLGPFPRAFSVAVGKAKDIKFSVSGATPLLRNMGELGGDGVVDGAITLQNIRVKSTGVPLKTIIANRQAGKTEAFAQPDGTLPELDFSGYDEQIQVARDLGFSRVNIRHGAGAMVIKGGNYITELTGSTNLSESWGKSFVDIWTQFKSYLEKKGFRQFTFKFGDELGVEEMHSIWLPMAKLTSAAGWMPETNPTGKAASAAMMNEIAPLCRSFILNVHFIDQFQKWKQAREVTLEKGTLIGTYGSWGYYKSPSFYTRKVFWEVWTKGLDGVDFYTYARLVLFDGDKAINCASGMGIQAGYADAVYLRMLQSAVDVAKSDPSKKEWLSKADAFLRSVVGEKSPYGLKMKEEMVGNMPYPKTVLTATTHQLDEAKRELLRLLSEGGPK